MKKTALVVCPGRGTYNKAELGYISNHTIKLIKNLIICYPKSI